MDIAVQTAKIKDPFNIDKFYATVTVKNWLFIRESIKHERTKLIRYLQGLKEKGEIKSNYRPKNKKIQTHLNEIVELNRAMRKSIEKIDLIFN